MICSTTYRTVLSLTASAIVTLGTYSILQASVDRTVATAKANAESPALEVAHSATIDRWQVASERRQKPGA